MRRFAPIFLLAGACSFDATGFGAPPETTVSLSATVGQGTSGDGETSAATFEDTVGVSGSGSASGTTGGPDTQGEVTTGPAMTTGPMTTGPMTTEPMTTEPCPTVMVWVDDDGDGYGDPNKGMMVCADQAGGFAGNGEDCDDASSMANPGLTELCDPIDNDCDGILNEYDAATNNTECLDCRFRTREGRLYYFCNWEADWEPARQFCQSKGLDLAIDSDGAEHDWMVAQADPMDGWGQLRWIGGRQNGDAFVWVDGSPVPQPDGRWANNEPNNQGLPFDGPADCLALVSPGPGWGTQWIDFKCGDSQKFTCEGPLP